MTSYRIWFIQKYRLHLLEQNHWQWGCRQMVCYKVSICRTKQHLNHRQGCVQVTGISRTRVRCDMTVLVCSVRAGSRTEQQ